MTDDTADSIGRRNTVFVDLCQALVKRLCRCLPGQRFAGTGIERSRDCGERVGIMSAEIRTFREVLA